MRKEFHVDPDHDKLDIKKLCPWAAVIHGCDGGWWCFESAVDFHCWLNQL